MALGERKCAVCLGRWPPGAACPRSLLPATVLSWKKWALYPRIIWLVPVRISVIRLNVLCSAGRDRTFHDFQASSGPFQVTQPPDPINDPTSWNSVGWTLPKRGGCLVVRFVLSFCWVLNWPRPPACPLDLAFLSFENFRHRALSN